MNSVKTKTNLETEIVVEFNNIDFGYVENIPILKNITFQIKAGQYICIVGHNGSGKSTLSKLLMGLVSPWSGYIKIFNTFLGLNTLKQLRNDMGIIFQNPDNQFIGLTTRDDIAFGLENRKVPYSLMNDIVTNVAEAVGISHFLNMEPTYLSGGQKQKVAIASVLAFNPKLIIFDEATSMLDSKSKIEIKKLIHDLSKEHHKTIISITHDMEEIINADLVMVLYKGNLVKFATPTEVLSDIDFLVKCKLNLNFLSELNYKCKNIGLNLPIAKDMETFATNIIEYKKQKQKKD